VLLGLEATVEADDEGIVGEGEDVSFGVDLKNCLGKIFLANFKCFSLECVYNASASVIIVNTLPLPRSHAFRFRTKIASWVLFPFFSYFLPTFYRFFPTF
jgi:hypothetical protein